MAKKLWKINSSKYWETKMNNIKVIAKNTFKETIRDRILYAILAFAVLFIASTVIFGSLSLGEDIKVINDFGLAGIYIFSIIITIFLGVTLIYKEIEKNTLYLILSKPVSKTQLIIGKYFGLLLSVTLTTLLMTVVFLVVVALKGGGFDSATLLVILLNLFEISIFIGISILFSTIFTPLLGTMLAIIILYVGHTLDMLMRFASKSESFMGYLVYPIYYLLPNLEKFNIRNQSVHGEMISTTQYLLAIFYALIYSAILLYLAKIALEQEEI